MYASFEISSNDLLNKGKDSIIKIDTNINSLSWMSKSTYANQISNNITKNNNQLDKFLYYQDGWLATGNSNCMVGCTFTSCFTEQQYTLSKFKTDKKETKNDNDSIISSNQNTNSINTSTSTSAHQNHNLNRTNFNLRGHKSEIKFVKWNEPYQKLATCDTKGLIYVWIKYEGRWSIELINDRGNSVSDFSWSHDGRAAVICYQDGFVLVGSVNGQRYWSHLYDFPNSNITSVTWTPNDNFILIGLSNGTIMVIDSNGTIQSRHNIKNNEPINFLSYNCPKFFIHDLNISTETNNSTSSSTLYSNRMNNLNNSNNNLNRSNRLSASLSNYFNNNENPNNSNNVNININNNLLNLVNEPPKINAKVNNQNYLLAVSLKSKGIIYILKSYDDFDPIIIETKLEGVKFEWSNCGKILAVGGYKFIKKTKIKNELIDKKKKSLSTSVNNNNPFLILKEYINYVHFYNNQGVLLYKIEIPTVQNDKNFLEEKLHLTSHYLVEKVKKMGDGENFCSNEQQLPLGSSHSTNTNQDVSFNNLFSALTWGHNDQRLFLACNNTIHILRVYKEIPTFSLLSQIALKTALKESSLIDKFCLPESLKQQLKYCFNSTIKSMYPRLHNLRKFVCTSSPTSERLHCTLKCIKTKNNYEYFTLFLEHLGGLIPLLSARKSSKIKPNFVIFDPILSINKKSLNKNPYQPNIGFKKRKTKLFKNSHNEKTDSCPRNLRDKTTNLNVTSNEKLNHLNTNYKSSGYNSSSTTDSSCSNNKILNNSNLLNPNKTDSIILNNYNYLKSNQNINKSISSSLSSFNSTYFASSHNNSFIVSKSAKSQSVLSNSSLSSLNSFSDINTFKNSLNNDIKFNIVLDSKKSNNNKQNNNNSLRFRRNILVKVKANVWGTKFKFQGKHYLPKNIGHIIYKTSLFHLQPRQMTICLEDLTYLNSVDFNKLINDSSTNNNLIFLKKNVMEKEKSKENGNSPKKIRQQNQIVKYSNIENLKSINSSTEGALPVNIKSSISKNNHILFRKISSCLSISSSSAILEDKNLFNNEQLNVNDKISTANQLIENKFIKNTFNLPQLKLISDDSISNYNDEEYDVNSCCLITSSTSATDNIDINRHMFPENSANLIKNNLTKRTNNILNKFTSDLIRYLTNQRFIISKSISINNRLLNETLDDEETTDFNNLRKEIDQDHHDIKNNTFSSNNPNDNNSAEEDENENLISNSISEKTLKSSLNFSKNKYLMKMRKKNKMVKSTKKKKNFNKIDNLKIKNKFVLHNKPPIWNETNQVYQLDFGGRVTQESAKNFQIEYNSKQVMQFGRIDTNAYTLDFEWPFTTIHAFSIALANITQRLK